eukprot:gene13850-13972_t
MLRTIAARNAQLLREQQTTGALEEEEMTDGRYAAGGLRARSINFTKSTAPNCDAVTGQGRVNSVGASKLATSSVCVARLAQLHNKDLGLMSINHPNLEAAGLVVFRDQPIARLPGLGIFYCQATSGVPMVLQHMLINMPALHRVVVLLTLKFIPLPYVDQKQKFLVRRSSKISGMFRVIVRYGYMEEVDQGAAFVRQLVGCLVRHVAQQPRLFQQEYDANIVHSVPSATGNTRPSSWLQMAAASCDDKMSTDRKPPASANTSDVVLELPAGGFMHQVKQAGHISPAIGPVLQRWASIPPLTPAEDLLAAAAPSGLAIHTIDAVEGSQGVSRSGSSLAPPTTPPHLVIHQPADALSPGAADPPSLSGQQGRSLERQHRVRGYLKGLVMSAYSLIANNTQPSTAAWKLPDDQLLEVKLLPDSVAYLLDYSGPPGFPKQLSRLVRQVIILDHHKTAAAQLADTSSHPANLSVHIDMQHSGAAIALRFFQPKGLSPAVEQMFRWVEDADLWTWKLPDSRAFHAGLAGQGLEYSAIRDPDIFDKLLDLDTQHVLQQGATVLQQQELLINEALAAAQQYQLGGTEGLTKGWGSCLGVKITGGDLVKFRSTLGNRLAERSKELGMSPVGLVAYVEEDMPDADTTIKISLRSVDGFDTSQISQAFGGGGHAAASSCIVNKKRFEGWKAMA